MSKTYKEKEDRKSLSKNHGENVRYRLRLQEEEEAKKEKEEALKRLPQYERNEYEDF